MLLYYIRHGMPVYDPDSLTPLGERQAEAAAKAANRMQCIRGKQRNGGRESLLSLPPFFVFSLCL